LQPNSDVRRIAVADVQIPFTSGGAELHVQSLIEQLRLRGYDADRVSVPFRPQAKANLLGQAAAWRLLDLTAVGSEPIDLLIATRFPSYFVQHPRKVAWVIHQHRAAYELCGTEYSDFTPAVEDVAIRQKLLALDAQMLGECRHVFTNARNTADRLWKFNGVTATPLYHPPPLAAHLRHGSYGNYVLSVGRLESVKRISLAIDAMPHAAADLSLIVVGDGSQRAALEQRARDLGLGGRVDFVGNATPSELVRLYENALAVMYVPFDEDYGYVTLEAFLASKPVITATDSGGTLEFVVDGENGCICPPDGAALARAMTRLAADRDLVARMGEAGRTRARAITWDGVVEQLLG
jgi:glycosyltransferase involved in cell wall biosynthesis